jgi:hypothetical protein
MLLSALPPGPFAQLAALLEGEKPGKPPISLAVGDPSGKVPDFITEASPARKTGARRRVIGSIAVSAFAVK